MMVNRYLPHVLVLPFIRRIQVLEEVGGWAEVLNRFESDHVKGMDRHPGRHLVLVIDFDANQGRLGAAKDRIPERLRDRVFVLGAWSEPEALRSDGLGSYETIGRKMAKDCREKLDATWGHRLLRHNASEIDRLSQHIRPFLFQQPVGT